MQSADKQQATKKLSVSWGELESKKFAEPIYLMPPWMRDNALCMVHSWRGIGKTYFCLALCQALASCGSFLKWKANMAKVFYFDCEMGEADIQNRYRWLNNSSRYRAHPDCMRLFSFEHTGGVTLNLADVKNQKIVEEEMGDSNLIVIDNLSAACKPIGRENMREAYHRLRDWLLSLKTRHIASLIVHHTGKNGTQRGISDIEDPLDIVLHLKRSEDWTAKKGTQFELHYEKTRYIDPKEASVLEALQITLSTDHEGKALWSYQPLDEVIAEKKKQKSDDIWTIKNDL